MQLARLVQGFLAEPGASIDQKAAAIEVRRSKLMRAADHQVTARAAIGPPAAPHRPRKRGLT